MAEQTKDKKNGLTDEQKLAVQDHGGALLVSAAAGSGKTRVLVARLLDRVEKGADVDRFLVITFTKAAAAELRDRIVKEVGKRFAADPGDRHLRRQMELIHRANISTLHSFCSQLIRENAAAIDVDPDFRLCDEGERDILVQQTLDRLLDERYETSSPDDDFFRLVDLTYEKKGDNDTKIAQVALNVFANIQSLADPERWLEEQENAWRLEGVTDMSETLWGRELLDDARETAEFALRRLEQALEVAQTDPVQSAKYSGSILRSIAGTRALTKARGWDEMRALMPVEFPRPENGRGADRTVMERMDGLRKKAKKDLDDLYNNKFIYDSERLLADLRKVSPAVRAVLALVRDFSVKFAAAKRRRGIVDFNDLEHFTLRLLYRPDGTATPLAESLRARFDEIMVDEFQDANQVQDAIYQALSGGRSLFMVGDVKQSIYRFRLADPGIFLSYYRDFAPKERAGEGEPRKLVLTRNFRSRPEVLAGVNDLFTDLMSPAVGEIEYTGDQRLVQGGDNWKPDARYRMELDVVSVPQSVAAGDGDEDGGGEELRMLEARAVAGRILELRNEGLMVGDKDPRPMEFSDVMILMRATKSVLHYYTTALTERGIPWTADMGENFFESTEVGLALSLLQIVDNPRQDVPLIAALRSPVYGFTDDRLAELRAETKDVDFYDAVKAAARRGEEDCADFLRRLERLRFGAGDRTCSQMVWHVYQQTNLLGLFSAMENGQNRRANLLAFYEFARAQEQAACRTIFDLLTRIRLIADNRRIPKSAPVGNGVRLMSIHHSKGLEAPVVFVCDLHRKFNDDDRKSDVLFHTRLGVGLKYYEHERGVKLDTPAWTAVETRRRREDLSEEMRLLYVATTRAKEKLILTMSDKRLGGTLAKIKSAAVSPVPPYAIRTCQNMGEWILLSALSRRSAAPLRELAGMEETEQDYTIPWDVRLIEGETAPQTAVTPGERQPAAPDAELPSEEELTRRFTWRYPHLGAVDVPSKLTATQIKKRAPRAGGAERQEYVPPLYRPRFAAEQMGLTPTQRGTALHLAMQFIDYAKTGDEAQLRAEIDRLVAQEYLTPLQGEAVDVARLAAFFRSPLGREAAAAGAHREFEFSLFVPAEEYFPQAAGEQLLLQGVVDCWYDTPEGITVLDFKSDRVTRDTAASRAEEYAPQLIAYARALGELTGRPVRRRVLWFFALDDAVEIPAEG